MADVVIDVDDRDRLIEEISLLRAKVARLQERVEQLDQLAHRDSLIDLPNRRGFMRELERLIARVERYSISGAMLFVDLDGLKSINDSFVAGAVAEAVVDDLQPIQVDEQHRRVDSITVHAGDQPL